MDIRENIEDREEVLRACIASLQKKLWTAMPCQITQDTTDGHTATAQPTIQRAVTDPVTGQLTFEDHPEHVDAPIHHMGGGGVSKTFPNKQGDTGTLIYASRPIDSWFQSDGSQQPIDDRMHSISDAMFLSGIRSIPRKLQQVAADSAQTRSDDAHHVVDLHPQNGHTLKSVDPSTPAASESYSPFTQATKYFDHAINPTAGHKATATDGGTVHSHALDHDSGFTASADNGAHTVTVHPQNGTGVTSSVAHTIQAPNASLDKAGNLTNQGSHTAQGAITSATSMSAPSGSFAAGSIGGVGFGAGGIMSLVGDVLQVASAVSANGGLSSPAPISSDQGFTAPAATVDLVLPRTLYTVASLNEEHPPSTALQGARAVVTDAMPPTYRGMLEGDGTLVCLAFCDGISWLAV